MSLKYQRVKQADQHLPAPLRWLTRAFSSITLSVILLSMVSLYGLLASVPITFIVGGLVYGLIILGSAGISGAIALSLIAGIGRYGRFHWAGRFIAGLIILGAGILVAILCCTQAKAVLASSPWFIENRATVIYRLPAFEMTELEFYSWWPLQLILCLFVINMIWATIRRIEFKFLNIGVLTVHTGIVTMAVGSVLYGAAKLEGDTILFRDDLGGTFVRSFYDGWRPALYFAHENGNTVMVDVGDLPRYNDYTEAGPRPLNIALHESEGFQQVFGGQVRATIREFIAYGRLVTQWVPADGNAVPADPAMRNPAIRVVPGRGDAPPTGDPAATLISGIPAQRVVDTPDWAIELLADPSNQRVADLMAEFEGLHGLVVHIPSQTFRETYSIRPGQTITLGETGYTLTVEEIGPYGLSFATAGYQGASDTRATIQVDGPDRSFRRMVLHRYPERSQDFVPAPEDPSAGPMGRRTDPDQTIELTYIDATKVQMRLITRRATPDAPMQLIARLPGDQPMLVRLPEMRIPIGPNTFLHIVDRMEHIVQRRVPVVTAQSQRDPKEEGTYLNALVPVDLEVDIPQGDGNTLRWQHRVWLEHMRYPTVPLDDAAMRAAFSEGRSRVVDIPTIGHVEIMFSRLQHELNFALRLDHFEMIPYPGSTIPRDYQSKLTLIDLTGPASEVGRERIEGITRLNNPLIHQGFKLSQTGWDPGVSADPNRERRDEQGRFTNQQRFSIIGVGNNVGIRIIFIGSCMVVAGIPWAFYVKPWLIQRRKRQLQEAVARGEYAKPKRESTPRGVAPAHDREHATVP